MNIDQDFLKRLAEEAFVPLAIEQHGEAGGRAIRLVMSALIEIYQYVELERLEGPLVVFRQIDNSAPQLAGSPRNLVSLADLQYEAPRGVNVEVMGSGQHRLWPSAQVDYGALSRRAVVYVWDGVDSVFAGGSVRRRSSPPGLRSWFQRPAFDDLKGALSWYRERLIRRSRCNVFRCVWFDQKQLFLKAGPETCMRRSLEQHLVSALRDADVEVRPEQVVDETHPVDIRVTFQFSNRVALIEIKWMGKSKRPNGSLAKRYSESRGKEGAKQLADYLDRNRRRAPTTPTMGYLVVIDARRRGLAKESTSVTVPKGFYYATREIQFDPAYHDIRDDFAEPFRMFTEPICE